MSTIEIKKIGITDLDTGAIVNVPMMACGQVVSAGQSSKRQGTRSFKPATRWDIATQVLL